MDTQAANGGAQVEEVGAMVEAPVAVEAKAVRRLLTGLDIMKVKDRKTIEVDVPEWGGFVKMRSLSAGESLEFAQAIKLEEKEGKGPSTAILRLLVKSLVGELNEPIFTQDHIEMLKERSMAVVMRLQDIALTLNGLNDKDAKEAAKKG